MKLLHWGAPALHHYTVDEYNNIYMHVHLYSMFACYCVYIIMYPNFF